LALKKFKTKDNSPKLIVLGGKKPWRLWLSKNHDKKSEAWLVIQKTGSKVKGVPYTDALEEALCWGWIDGIMHSIDRDRYRLRFSPRKPKSMWSMVNKNKAMALIKSGRMTKAGLAKIEEAKKNGMWKAAYTSKKSSDLPCDLKRAIEEAKQEETRKKRIGLVVERAVKNLKPGM
jgi:uncharacterized protein YdeI (YjbR/CyaY-like superfamily)